MLYDGHFVFKTMPNYNLFCANLMNLAAIFRVLEHLNDFEIIDHGSHFVFQNRAKFFSGKTFAGQYFSSCVFTF